MAQPSDQLESEELTDKARLEFAVREIEASPYLRFFVRQFLSFCHVLPPASVYDVDPRQNAKNQGVQEAGFEFCNMLTSAAPHLVPALMLEELLTDEQND